MPPEHGNPQSVPARGTRAILTAACDVGAIGLLAYLVVSRLFYLSFGVGVAFDPSRVALISIAAAFVVLRRLVSRLSPRVTLACWTTLAGAGAGLALLPALGVDPAVQVRAVVLPLRAELLSLVSGFPLMRDLYRLDERYGYVLIPNATTVRHGVTYTIDAEGHRVTPAPQVSRATVVFLGDSVTFGDGVGDHEAYPAVLARDYWTDLRIVNAAVDGWGLTQFHLALTDWLVRSPRPDAIVVAMIDHDLRRSHLRPPLVPGQRRRLEWMGGAFVSRAIDDAPAIVGETPDLLDRETRLATATFDAMHGAARAAGVALGIVLLGDPVFPPDLVYALGRRGIPTLDLTRLNPSLLPHDLHPDAGGHRAIAAAIAASPLHSLAYRRAADLDGQLEPRSTSP